MDKYNFGTNDTYEFEYEESDEEDGYNSGDGSLAQDRYLIFQEEQKKQFNQKQLQQLPRKTAMDLFGNAQQREKSLQQEKADLKRRASAFVGPREPMIK